MLLGFHRDYWRLSEAGYDSIRGLVASVASKQSGTEGDDSPTASD